MAKKPNVRKLPERECREMLAEFLQVLGEHPELSHFRACVPAGPERQLALFAALERAAFRGNSATAPPAHDDLADQLLCDLLEVIDRDLSNHGSYYGADRHRVNLQALGAWTGQPHALELFTTTISQLTAAHTTTYPSLEPNYSPAPQITAQIGDLIAPDNANSQANSHNSAGIIHHTTQTPGDKVGPPGPKVGSTGPGEPEAPPTSLIAVTTSPPETIDLTIPSRPLRRGRPPLIDDIAKGRLLGLISSASPSARPPRSSASITRPS
jgi:hypothetical protein